jgi:hypothetical protein
MIDSQAARDLYLARFGQLFDRDDITKPDPEEATLQNDLARFGPLFEYDDVMEPDREEATQEDDLAGDEDRITVKETLQFQILTFWTPEPAGAAITYASLGVTGDEFYLTAATPYEPFKRGVEELAGGSVAALEPLTVVRHSMRLTSFDAMLVAPADDGTFALGEVDGRLRRALRLVPITPAERLLAARDPERLLGLLRVAGALIADPVRPCVVAPEQGSARRANVAALLDEARRRARRASESHQKMCDLHAPEMVLEPARAFLATARATLAFLEERVPAILPESDAPELRPFEEQAAMLGALARDVMACSVEPYRGLVPRRVAELFVAFVCLALCTHPLLQPLTYEATMGAGRRPADDGAGWLELELLAETARATLLKLIPTASDVSKVLYLSYLRTTRQRVLGSRALSRPEVCSL